MLQYIFYSRIINIFHLDSIKEAIDCLNYVCQYCDYFVCDVDSSQDTQHLF